MQPPFNLQSNFLCYQQHNYMPRSKWDDLVLGYASRGYLMFLGLKR